MYNRQQAVDYAREWAFFFFFEYYTFDEIGGDCTNFVSQCLYAGSGVMNYTPDFGWYYISPDDRSAAWTGVQYLYNFLTTNEGNGPYGSELPLALAQIGDVIQLSFDGINYAHTLIITRIILFPTPRNILIASHSNDSFDRPLDTYNYQAARLIHISGVRGQQ
ncbi:MAG: amidase domain-containing protein [Ruminococcaceae bacterium]|nr:amidase domain-containing protein [Oscillospiraceae bacterium]